MRILSHGALFLLPLTVSASTLFQDNFNYTDAFTNHGWDDASGSSSIAVGAGPDGSNALRITFNCDSNSCGDRWHNWSPSVNTQELVVTFDFKLVCNAGNCTGGGKFLKLFGQNSAGHYANATTALVYQTAVFEGLSYGCSGDPRDTASVMYFSGADYTGCGGTLTGTHPGEIDPKDAQWHSWKVHMRYNDDNVSNAVFGVWYDGAKIAGITGVTNRANAAPKYFDHITLGGWNQFYGSVPYSILYDNVVITDSVSSSDTTPPAAPTGLGVN